MSAFLKLCGEKVPAVSPTGVASRVWAGRDPTLGSEAGGRKCSDSLGIRTVLIRDLAAFHSSGCQGLQGQPRSRPESSILLK